jgi:hypothetical protein
LKILTTLLAKGIKELCCDGGSSSSKILTTLLARGIKDRVVMVEAQVQKSSQHC